MRKNSTRIVLWLAGGILFFLAVLAATFSAERTSYLDPATGNMVFYCSYPGLPKWKQGSRRTFLSDFPQRTAAANPLIEIGTTRRTLPATERGTTETARLFMRLKNLWTQTPNRLTEQEKQWAASCFANQQWHELEIWLQQREIR